jgi:hypothetical protein
MIMKSTQKFVITALLSIAACTCFAWDMPPTGGDPESTNEVGNNQSLLNQKNWSGLPLWASSAYERGHELPLPLGVSFVYNYMARDIKVNDVRIGVNGAPPQSVSGVLNLGSNSKVDAYLVKVDAWVLPFVNVYAMSGYLHNESTSRGVVDFVPGLPPAFHFEVPTSLDGVVVGGGGTLAMGYKQVFLMVDANYSVADIGFADQFTAITASTRIGWNGKIKRVPFRVWVGAAYWDTFNTARSTIDEPGIGTISFEADQGPQNPWNATVGTAVTLHRKFDAFMEYGFNFSDVQILATGLAFRF